MTVLSHQETIDYSISCHSICILLGEDLPQLSFARSLDLAPKIAPPLLRAVSPTYYSEQIFSPIDPRRHLHLEGSSAAVAVAGGPRRLPPSRVCSFDAGTLL